MKTFLGHCNEYTIVFSIAISLLRPMNRQREQTFVPCHGTHHRCGMNLALLQSKERDQVRRCRYLASKMLTKAGSREDTPGLTLEVAPLPSLDRWSCCAVISGAMIGSLVR